MTCQALLWALDTDQGSALGCSGHPGTSRPILPSELLNQGAVERVSTQEVGGLRVPQWGVTGPCLGSRNLQGDMKGVGSMGHSSVEQKWGKG